MANNIQQIVPVDDNNAIVTEYPEENGDEEMELNNKVSNTENNNIEKSTSIASTMHTSVLHYWQMVASNYYYLLIPYRIFFRYVPFVNLIYDIFDEDPTLNSIKELLNLIGLVNALLIALSLTIMTAVDYETFEDAQIRFFNNATTDGEYNGYYEWRKEYNGQGRLRSDFNSLGALFVNNCVDSTMLFLGAFAIALLSYLDLVSKNFDAETERRSLKLVSKWWMFMKLPILVSVIMSFFGAFICASAMLPLIYANVPDIYIEEHGDISTNYRESPYGYANYVINTVGNTSFWVTLFFLSFATGLVFHERHKQNKRIAKSLEGEILIQSKKQWEDFFNRSDISEYFHYYKKEYIEIFNDAQLDFNDRAIVSDENLIKLGINLTGHRVKLLHLFSEK